MAQWWRYENAQSIDSIPALDAETAGVNRPFECRKISYTSKDKAEYASLHEAGSGIFGGIVIMLDKFGIMLDARFMIGLVLGVVLTLMMGHPTILA